MLTPRESQVLARLVQGDSNPAIAASLACTVRTVEFHVTNLLKKTGHVSRAALSAAVWALG
jgi:DNA-binding CsgD family transcriptional regulator